MKKHQTIALIACAALTLTLATPQLCAHAKSTSLKKYSWKTSTIAYNWGTNGPQKGAPKDNYQAEIKRTVNTTEGDYWLQAYGDDHAELLWDNKQVTTSTKNIKRTYLPNVTQGQHTLTANVTDRAGESAVFADVVPVNDWIAYKYDNANASGAPTKVETFKQNKTAFIDQVTSADKSARYSAAVRLPLGEHQLVVTAPTAAKLTIDGQTIVPQLVNETWVYKLNINKSVHFFELTQTNLRPNTSIQWNIVRSTDNVPTESYNWTALGYTNRNFAGQAVTLQPQRPITFGETSIEIEVTPTTVNAALPADNFSLAFNKKAAFTDGIYRFDMATDDTLEVFLNGTKLWDIKKSDGRTTRKIPISTSTRDLVVKYRSAQGSAALTFQMQKETESYATLDLRKPSNATAQDIANYIRTVQNGKHADSPLLAYTDTFITAGEKYGINALFLAAHAIHESNYGKSQIAVKKNNLFGLGAYDFAPFENALYFPSLKESIEMNAWLVRKYYLEPGAKYNKGQTVLDVNRTYATDSRWGILIAGIMEAIKPYNPAHYNSITPSNLNTTDDLQQYRNSLSTQIPVN
ncbi:MAG: glucosaminidase domain-containing protein [Bacilli bacterium]